jgi:hypothetical protein
MIKLTDDAEIVIENPSGKFCMLLDRRPLTIPFDLLLAIHSKSSSTSQNQSKTGQNQSKVATESLTMLDIDFQVLGRNKSQKVFDKALDYEVLIFL